MATRTPNLNLIKPDGTDYVQVSDFNTNSTITDSAIGNPAQLETSDKHSLVAAINETRRAASARSPYIGDNGNWWEWDTTTAQFVDSGVRAQGSAAGFDAPTASTTTLDAAEPAEVLVDATGPDTGKIFNFEFRIPRGGQGIPGTPVEMQLFGGYIQWRIQGSDAWINLVPLADITGNDGREIELAPSATHIQWRYVGESLWKDLVSLSAITGPAGREVEFQKSDTHIQWRYVGDSIWVNLISLSEITGPDGRGLVILDFFPTLAALQAAVPLPRDGDAYGVGTVIPFNIYIFGVTSGWVNNGPLQGPPGTSGREIELQTTSTHIQWRYVGDTAWTNLIALSVLTGPQGTTGSDGREVSIRVFGGYIQWQHVGDPGWTNLISVSELIGPQGIQGPPGTPADPAITIALREDLTTTQAQVSELATLVGITLDEMQAIVDGDF